MQSAPGAAPSAQQPGASPGSQTDSGNAMAAALTAALAGQAGSGQQQQMPSPMQPHYSQQCGHPWTHRQHWAHSCTCCHKQHSPLSSIAAAAATAAATTAPTAAATGPAAATPALATTAAIAFVGPSFCFYSPTLHLQSRMEPFQSLTPSTGRPACQRYSFAPNQDMGASSCTGPKQWHWFSLSCMLCRVLLSACLKCTLVPAIGFVPAAAPPMPSPHRGRRFVIDANHLHLPFPSLSLFRRASGRSFDASCAR